MNLKRAKRLRRLVFGPAGQGKTEYETVNPARGRRVTLEAPMRYRTRINGFLPDVVRIRAQRWEDIFTPSGTVHCVGPRAIYQRLKNKGAAL